MHATIATVNARTSAIAGLVALCAANASAADQSDRRALGLLLGALVLLWSVTFSSSVIAVTDDRPPQTCKDRIIRAVCLAAPVRNVFRSRRAIERRCDERGLQYVPQIMRIYDRLPVGFQQEMCALDRIYIEKGFWASGYAHLPSKAIGIHQRILDKQMSLSEFATWKERLAFAIKQVDTHILQSSKIELPVIKATAPGGTVTAAFYIITHEIAHLIDQRNRIVGRSPGNFSLLSWRWKGSTVRRHNMHADWQAPCFYRCRKKKISLVDAGRTYDGLMRSAFVSLYATRSPYEDFAETATYYVLAQQPGFNLEVYLGRSKIFDLSSLRRNPVLRKKLDYVESLLRGRGSGLSVSN